VTAPFLFEDLPRVALAVLVGGLVLRWLLLARRPLAGNTAAPAPDWRRFGRVGGLALALVVLAHLVALVAPQALAVITRSRLRLYLLEGGGYLVGLVAALAWGRAMVRHLRTEGPTLAGVADSALLALVAVALVSGLVTAVLYRWASLWGAARSRLLRLKQPKYAFGALVGIGYFYFFFIRPRGITGPRGPNGGALPDVPAEALVVIVGVAALALFLIALISWFVPRQAALAFSEAEIAFLFPAPVSRRMLIHYRILSSQFRLVFTAIIFTLVFRRGITFTHAVGWWVILATLNLHFTGSSFVTTRLLNRTLTPPPRRNAILVIAALVAIALVAWGWFTVAAPTMSDLRSGGTIAHYLRMQLDRGPLPWLLAIPRITLAPYFATSAHAFVLAIGPALLVLAIHYFWVLQSEVSFEEASISRAEKRAARVRAIQQGDWRNQGQTLKPQRPPFNLASTGRPEVAFLWKNLLATSALFRPVSLLLSAIVVFAVGSWLGHRAATS